MAVYKRSYKGYAGEMTPEWSRFLVIPTYAYRSLFQSKMLVAFFVLCFVYPIACAAFVYVIHNLGFLATYRIRVTDWMVVNGKFFLVFLHVQGVMAFILTAFVGPSLISADLANSALPLYLCRPFSRTEYVLGKMSVIAILLSMITWVPGLILFIIQSSLEGFGWFQQNLWMAGGIFLGAWIWILVLSFLALALSAWVRWKLAASALLLATFFVAAGFGQLIDDVLLTKKGLLINLVGVMETIWGRLLGVHITDISFPAACCSLAVTLAICLLLLAKKLKAFEVVR